MNRYKVLPVKQLDNSSVEFLVFVADARDVNRWAHADDIRLDRGNVQRALVESRWKQVKKFFSADPEGRNVIPTNITVAFDDQIPRVQTEADLVEGREGFFLGAPVDGVADLVFTDAVHDRTFVIDGQHRLHGMAAVGERVSVPVSLLFHMSSLERAFQFVTINNKSHKVPTDNLKALINNFDAIEDPLRYRLSHASITAPRFATYVDVMNEQSESPFYKMVDWVNNRHQDAKRQIAVTAIENSLKAITRAFPETKDDEADAILVLSTIWHTIFNTYGVTFQNVEEFPNLLKKAVIQQVSEMIVERIVRNRDPAFSVGPITRAGAKEAAETADLLVREIPADFWKEEWPMKSLDTSAGRALIADSIRKLKSNVVNKPDEDWRTDVPIYRKIEPEVGDEANT